MRHLRAPRRPAGTTEVDAHTALFALTSLAFMSFPFGVATAASIRVGNLLGEGKPRAAKAAGVLLMQHHICSDSARGSGSACVVLDVDVLLVCSLSVQPVSSLDLVRRLDVHCYRRRLSVVDRAALPGLQKSSWHPVCQRPRRHQGELTASVSVTSHSSPFSPDCCCCCRWWPLYAP